MQRTPVTGFCTRRLWNRLLTAALAIAIAPVSSALAQTTTPGSTVNGTVPTSEGNRWNGLDHQPTQSEVPPLGNARQQARISHKLNKLDRQLLNQPLPEMPNDTPPGGQP